VAASRQRVFIAGATGYLGGFLTSEFAKRGHDVAALSRSRAGAERLVEHGVTPVIAEATDPASLSGHLDDIDVVVSALGITRQKDGLSYEDVDYQANVNLLRAAERAGTKRFVYVSVFRGDALTHTAIGAAKERFVRELRRSPIQSLIVRPTGFFSDMEQILAMARKGRVWQVGKGLQRLNPIAGEDLARVIADAVDDSDQTDSSGQTEVVVLGDELPVGGPEEFTMREIAELAFDAAGKKPRFGSVPMWLVGASSQILPRTTPQSIHGPMELFLAVSRMNMVAPSYGSHRLADHFSHVVAATAE